MSATKTPVEVEGKALTLSNLDKVLYPAVALTKRDVLRYYTAIGPVLLPHLAGRPVTFKRAPDGMAGGAFFEKHVPRGAPGWLKTITVPAKDVEGSKGNGEIIFPAISDLASLVWAANLAALELHVPMWRIGPKGVPRRPDLLVFDLDPGAPADITQCCQVALLLREDLERDGFEPLAKTSGSKGLQLYARLPVRGGPRSSSDYAHDVARRLEATHASLVTSVMRKELRRAKVLIDWSQNNPSKTTVAPYSLRLTDDATVSTPISWDEVTAAAAGDAAQQVRFSTDDVLERVGRLGDLFAPLHD